jgi:hypothetical protein
MLVERRLCHVGMIQKFLKMPEAFINFEWPRDLKKQPIYAHEI